MTPEEKAQLDANTKAVVALSRALQPLTQAVSSLASLTTHQTELLSLKALVPICGALFAEIAKGSVDPGQRLDEMLSGIEGRLIKAMDQSDTPENVRAHLQKVVDEIIGFAEVLVRRS